MRRSPEEVAALVVGRAALAEAASRVAHDAREQAQVAPRVGACPSLDAFRSLLLTRLVSSGRFGRSRVPTYSSTGLRRLSSTLSIVHSTPVSTALKTRRVEFLDVESSCRALVGAGADEFERRAFERTRANGRTARREQRRQSLEFELLELLGLCFSRVPNKERERERERDLWPRLGEGRRSRESARKGVRGRSVCVTARPRWSRGGSASSEARQRSSFKGPAARGSGSGEESKARLATATTAASSSRTARAAYAAARASSPPPSQSSSPSQSRAVLTGTLSAPLAHRARTNS